MLKLNQNSAMEGSGFTRRKFINSVALTGAAAAANPLGALGTENQTVSADGRHQLSPDRKIKVVSVIDLSEKDQQRLRAISDNIDLQLLKEHLFPAFNTLKDCISMAGLMLNNIEVKENLLKDEKYKYLFSVEEVNKLVLKGTAFRDAYREVGLSIETNTYRHDPVVNHTHEGSIGNLCTAEIKANMENTLGTFPFQKVEAAIKRLLS